MSNRKKQKEIDKAINHLMKYVDNTEHWSSRYEQLHEELLAPVTQQTGHSTQDILQQIFSGPFEGTAVGYLFEAMVSADNGHVVSDYLEKRGWRESFTGKEYLTALGQSKLRLWEIVDLAPGEWAEVRLYGSEDPPQRVQEKAATQDMKAGMCLAARVMLTGKYCGFSGSIMPLDPIQAERVQSCAHETRADIQRLHQAMLDGGQQVLDAAALIEEAVDEARLKITFSIWVTSVVRYSSAPNIRNTDGDELLFTTYRFPLLTESQSIATLLDQHFLQASDNEWIWTNAKQQMLGHIRIKKHLELKTHSIERGKKGIAQLQALLGDNIGQPMGVHQTLESAMADAPNTPQDNTALHDHPDIQAGIQAHFQQHYQKTLDEPVPMLDNNSPRACAADPGHRDKVIAWLKSLEMRNTQTGQVFDTTWMWDELGLADYR